MTTRNAAGRHFSHAAEPPSRHIGRRIAGHVARLLLVLGATLASLVAWLSRTWAELTPDEIIYHLRASFGGTDTTVIWTYLLCYLPFVIGSCVLAFLLMGYGRRKGMRAWTASIVAVALAGAALTGGALYAFSRQVDLASFLSIGEDTDFIGEHYTNPDEVEVTFPEQKRNLVYIFLESMELTYADEANGGIWGENLIGELTQLAHEGETFAGSATELNGALVLPGCGWTMAGMFCQSSGVPLKLPTHNNRSSLVLDDFFPELICLGDLLSEQGYRQHLLIGSDATFGNRREYYTEHGGFDIFDYNRALDEGFIPEGYKEFWGFEDEKLFAKAREVIAEAAQGDAPFNVTLLTVDTHFEDGYVCHLCGEEHGDDQYANVMSCSSRQVVDFVRWIQAQDFYDNTTVILCGDHTTMDKDFCEDVPESYQRRTYTCVLNSAVEPIDQGATRSYATTDLYPTTLAALGCGIEGDRLGLGTNLYGQTPTLIEELGLDACTEGFKRRSEFLDSYSHVPEGEQLVDMIMEQAEFKLSYKYADDGADDGFWLDGINNFNEELVESAHLDLTDTRTDTMVSYPMEITRDNENWVSLFYLLARVSIPEDELKYYRAECHVTIEGDRDRVYATWDGAGQSG